MTDEVKPTTPHTTDHDMTLVGQMLVLPSRTYVTPLELTPEQIDIADIARGLSRTCRYNGHVAGFMSVAEHSVMVSHLVQPQHALAALLHDAEEAYLGDMIRPIKKHPKFAFFREIEAIAQAAVAEKFGFEYPHHAEVVAADDQQLRIEMDTWRDDPKRYMNPKEAEAFFLERFYYIMSHRHEH